jgi:FixJ family two-component response regulator
LPQIYLKLIEVLPISPDMKQKKATIAVVDDDDRLLRSLENLMLSFGYDVRAHVSGESLLNSNDIGDLDCLVSDVGMPGISGIQLLERVRAMRPDLPVILITGRQEKHLSLVAQRLGARYFEKPLDSVRLIEAVRSALGTA